MLYRFRHTDGTLDPFSSGTYIDASGKSRFLSVSDFTLTPHGATFTSPTTKATYPIQWHVSVPSLKLDVELRTPLADQELVSEHNVSLTYWEGAITITGTRDGKPSTGVGYLEMTGYTKPVYLGEIPVGAGLNMRWLASGAPPEATRRSLSQPAA
jgi:predicted secreted hydrolase